MHKLASLPWVGPGLVVLFVVPVLVYGLYSIGDRWYQNYLLAQQEAALRADIQRLREQNLQLQRELEEARSDAAIEAIAREQLGLVKPGDQAIQIVGPAGTTAAQPRPRQEPPASERPPVPPKPIWLRLLDVIFGR